MVGSIVRDLRKMIEESSPSQCRPIGMVARLQGFRQLLRSIISTHSRMRELKVQNNSCNLRLLQLFNSFKDLPTKLKFTKSHLQQIKDFLHHQLHIRDRNRCYKGSNKIKLSLSCIEQLVAICLIKRGKKDLMKHSIKKDNKGHIHHKCRIINNQLEINNKPQYLLSRNSRPEEPSNLEPRRPRRPSTNHKTIGNKQIAQARQI